MACLPGSIAVRFSVETAALFYPENGDVATKPAGGAGRSQRA